MKSIAIQHILMSSNIVQGTEPLYCRSEKSSFPISLNKNESLDFRAHFNFIPIWLLKKNHISEINIELTVEGDADLCLYVDDHDAPFIKKPITDVITVEVPEGRLLGMVIVANNRCTVFDGLVSCNVDSYNEVKLAIAICTFRREKTIVSKMESINCYIKKFNLKDKIIPIVIDNGRTLNCPDTIVIPSRNLGGSGGFSKGMIEALNRGCTHVILNDDDALLEPEILFRTLSLLSIAEKNVIIGGAMISLEKPTTIYESGTFFSGSETLSPNNGVDITTISGNLKISEKQDINYTGWWYSVFPVSLIKKNGCALPFFYKEDDIEYGLRSNIEKITVCGLSVWHPEPKYNPSANYYYIRNRLATISSHEQINRKVIRSFISKVLLEISAYRYENANMMILGLRDFSKGPQHIYEKCKEEPITTIIKTTSLDELRKTDDYSSNPKKCNIVFRMMTMNGLILRPTGNTEKQYNHMKTEDFYRMGKIIYRVNDEEGFIAKKKTILSIKLTKDAMFLYLSLIMKEKKLSKWYKKELPHYSSVDYWNNIQN